MLIRNGVIVSRHHNKLNIVVMNMIGDSAIKSDEAVPLWFLDSKDDYRYYRSVVFNLP